MRLPSLRSAAFLVRHPLKLALGDGQRGKWYPRTSVAGGAASAVAAVCWASAWAFPWPSRARPISGRSRWRDSPRPGPARSSISQGRSRELLPEIAGALALAVTAPAMLVAGGLGPDLAALVFGLSRSGPPPRFSTSGVVSVCTRGVATSRVPPVLAHVVSLLVTLLAIASAADRGSPSSRLASCSPAPSTAFPQACSAARRGASGFQELGFGLATTLLVAFGVRLSL